MKVYQSFHSSPSLHGFDQPVGLVVRQRLEPRVRALKGNRFKKGHFNYSLSSS